MLDQDPASTPVDDQGTPVPQGPWFFLKAGLAGGASSWGLQLLAGWLCFDVLTSTLWAEHLKALAGWSSLPSYWGELITVRDVWELLENGGLKNHLTGFWAPLAALASLGWFLWAGWKLQARSGGVRGRFTPWAWGFLEALVLGALPLGLLASGLLWLLGILGDTGIQGLGWLNAVGSTLLRLACVSGFFLQAWLCRLDRAPGAGWNLGGWKAFGGHLSRSFLLFWTHPIQWTVLVVAGVVLRTGLLGLVLVLGWRMGGGTPVRVWAFLGLQAVAVGVNAWLIGWFLRVTALFWKHERAVRAVIMDLEAAASGK